MFLAYGLPAGAIITTPANVEPKQSIIQNANRLEEDQVQNQEAIYILVKESTIWKNRYLQVAQECTLGQPRHVGHHLRRLAPKISDPSLMHLQS